MKKIGALGLAIISSVSILGQTSKYHKFNSENVEWKELLVSYTFEYDSFAIIQSENIWGDTLIDGKLYYKMNTFLLYEDTVNRKVYARDYVLDWPDTLLYDFNLEVGQSAAHCAEFSASAYFPDAVVTKIDSVLIGTYRKRWEIKYTPSLEENSDSITYWIEGIGSDNGIFNPYSGWYWPDIRRLICYTENDSILYSNLQYWYSCDQIYEDTTDDIREIKVESSVQLNPNPADDYTELKITPNGINESKSITVVNGNNQIVLRDITNENQYLINCSNLSTGLYLVVISGRDYILTQKLIITR